MKTVAIICEYDPFHRGHKHQIELIRENFGSDTTVISLMSGSVVQRGRLSVYPKHLRAEAAIKCGSDLVLELPCPWCCSSAEFFAMGAVSLLNSLGGVDILAFGSESGNINELTDASSTMLSEQFISAMRSEGKNGHIKASENVFSSLGGKNFPALPNDILGIEYISAIKRTNSSIVPFTYKRENGWSATSSRELLMSGDDPSEMIPDEAMQVFNGTLVTSSDIYSHIAMHTILATPENELSKYFGMNGGVSGLIKSNADEVTSVYELVEKCTGKSYTSARIRRAILSSILMITEKNVREEPQFTTLLAANNKGREFLSEIRKTSTLKIIAKTADGTALDFPSKEQFELSLRSDKLMSLCRGQSASDVFRRAPFIAK